MLDGVIDPTQDLATFLLAQSASFQAALQRSMDVQAAAPSCPLGSDPMARAIDLAAKVEAAPLADGSGVELSEDGPLKPVGPAEFGAGVVEAMYDSADWPALWAAIADGLTGKGDKLGRLADAYYDYGGYTAYAATTCVDVPHPEGSLAYRELVARATAASPLLGPGIANEMLPCALACTDHPHPRRSAPRTRRRAWSSAGPGIRRRPTQTRRPSPRRCTTRTW